MQIIIYLLVIGIVIIIGFLCGESDRKRKESIECYAKNNGLVFKSSIGKLPVESKFGFNDCGYAQKYEFVLMGEKDGISFATLDYTFSTGNGRYYHEGKLTVCLLTSDDAVFPDFTARDESFSDNIDKLFGTQDINFSDDETFSKMFILQGPIEASIRNYFRKKVRKGFVEGHKKGYIYEAHDNTFAVLTHSFMNADDRAKFLENSINIYKKIIPSQDDDIFL